MRHALRNAAVPLLNLLGIQLSTLLGGVLVVEYIFDYPGLGQLTVECGAPARLSADPGHRDRDQRRSSCLINILVDVVATRIDPRLDY